MLFPAVSLLCLVVCSQIPTGEQLAGSLFCEARDGPARFVSARGPMTAFFADDAIALSLRGDGEGDVPGVHLFLRLLGASPDVRVVPEGEPLSGVRSYRAGGVSRSYRALRYDGVLAGTDLRILERHGRLTYDLLLEAGADLSAFAMRVEGATGLRLVDEVTLVVETEVGPLVQHLPAAWQIAGDGTRRPVAARFRLRDAMTFGFDVDGLDPGLPLVIDPGLDYGTYLGGSLLDRALDVARAADGDVVLVGQSFSADFPATAGAWQEDLVGDTDAFVARIDPETGTLEFATYLGGDDADILEPETAHSVAIAEDGTIVVCGRTRSTDFPTTTGAYAESSTDGNDAFVARLSAGGALQWCTYLGGPGNDIGRAVGVDSANRVIVAGASFADGFPVTPGAFDEDFSSTFFTSDAFVARLSTDGSQLDWATYLGGPLREDVGDLVVDGDECVVVGLTGSSEGGATPFPTTAGAYDETYNGSGGSETDAFALRLSAAGDQVLWGTYFGGAEVVEARAVARASNGDIVIGGLTRSDDLPGTAGSVQPDHGGGLTDGFVARLSGDGSTLHWATYLGGADADQVDGVALGGGNLPTAVGVTRSSDFPLRTTAVDHVGGPPSGPGLVGRGQQAGSPTSIAPPPTIPAPDPDDPTIDRELDGPEDGFVVRLVGGGERLLYGTYLGGSDADGANGVVLDDFGAALVAGETRSTDMPVTAQAVDDTPNGNCDAFLVRVAMPPFERLPASSAPKLGRPPRLLGTGSLEPGTRYSLRLDGAPPEAPAALLVGAAGGRPTRLGDGLLTWPPLDVLVGTTDRTGSLLWARGRVPDVGIEPLVLQSWVADPAAAQGVSASNGLRIGLR